ncbi:MAG: hypothetical protein IPI97_06380 [Nitrosomonas sp.]|nr:hypothetical protein [Nitrosomonas sp.]MBK7364622.1 hypothetical protein [Nitrosomonas sp.]
MSLISWINAIDELFSQKNYKRAYELIQIALADFKDHPRLLDRWFIVNEKWNLPLISGKFHLLIPEEGDFQFLQQCYGNNDFMEQFLPMGRKNQSNEAIFNALKHNKFPVAQFRAMHRIIKKNQAIDQTEPGSQYRENLKSIGLVSLIDIQIAHRRAELLMGFPNESDRQFASSVVMLLIFDFAFNQIGLQKLTSLVLANNTHSQRSTEAIGFLREGFKKKHFRHPKSYEWLDCYENGLNEENFRTNSTIARISERILKRNITLNNSM